VAELESDNKTLAAEFEAARQVANKLMARVDQLREQLREQSVSRLTRTQYRNLQFCLHPDRVAAFQDEEITARYTEAFRWLVGQSVREA
jgi:hypothetical protein